MNMVITEEIGIEELKQAGKGIIYKR